MKKVTKKVIATTTKDYLNEIAELFKIKPAKKTQKAIDKLATKFSLLLKGEISKQKKKKLKSKAEAKSKKEKKVIPVQ